MLLACGMLSAQKGEWQLSDSAQVSLLTCTPGTEVYSRFGHSALRITDPVQGIDWTFNYGVFNFNSDHFYARFVKGDTRYQLDVESTDWFIVSSAAIGRETMEQVLHLTQEEKQALTDALILNYQPRNRYYLYNFVFDNCATRPYNILSRVLRQESGDTLLTTEFDLRRDTYRERILHYTGKYSWLGYGVSLIFGSDADRIMTSGERLFLPEELMNYVAEAQRQDGSRLCMAADTHRFEVKDSSWIWSPYMAEIVTGLFLLLITLFDMRRNRVMQEKGGEIANEVKVSWWADIILFIVGGVLGIIMFYLSYFSIHPLVKHNWNLLLVNPLLIVAGVLLCVPKIRKWTARHIGTIGVLWFILFIIRFAGSASQPLHWLMLLPAVHSVRWIALGYKNLANDFRHIFHKKDMKKGEWKMAVGVVALLLTVMSGRIQAEPRLTVVIAIDGLHQQPMQELRSYWQQGGLRILDEEAHESVVSFPYLVYGGAETLAGIMTGTTPAVNGIASDAYFRRSDRKVHSILEDEEQTGIGCEEHLSPKALLAPTLTDEFRLFNSERSRIYAIGIDPISTILLAGHGANACTWIDPEHQGWATTGYYSEGLPNAADKMNTGGRFAELSAKEWTPRMDVGMYIHPTAEERGNKGFHYVASEVLRHSPIANTLVTELALALQKDLQLGQTTAPDMLLLQMTVTSPSATSDLLSSAEQEDMYLRLNQDLGYLMEQLTKRVGRDNLRFVVFGLPRKGQGDDNLQRANLQAHFFNTDRAAALINTYLMAMYGHERWIDGSYGQSIYLNRTLIEQKKMSLKELQQQVSSFLLEFEGTEAAFASTDIALLTGEGESAKLRNSCNKRCTGDVVFTLQPLWRCGESQEKAFDRVADTAPKVPFYMWTTERTPLPDRQLNATQLSAIILQ